MGTVILRDAVTVTDGRGTLAGSADVWQPANPSTAAAVTHEQASPVATRTAKAVFE